MAKLCSNCGTQVGDNVKFCGSCGQAMPQQHVPLVQPTPVQQQPYIQPEVSQQPIQPQYQSPPADQPQYQQTYMPSPAQPKSKTPFIFAGVAGLAVIALITVAVVTKGFGLLGNGLILSGITQSDRPTQTATGQTDKPTSVATTQTGSTLITVPKNASAEEKLAYSYIEYAAEIYGQAIESEVSFPYCADAFYAVAAVNVNAMRYAVDCLLELKGISPEEDGRLRDWDTIAALGWISPFPYFFEGVVLDAKGDSSSAAECYRKAALNPNFTDDIENYKTIKDLDEKALKSLKTVLEEQEDKIYEATYGFSFVFIPRDENNFDIEYLRGKAIACLRAEEVDLFGALDYYLAALQINPFDGDNYANLAIVSLFMEDSDMYSLYIDEGLAIDPDNVRLKFIQDPSEEANGR